MTGLVLAGGGARGAYEAGVLRFLYETLPRRAGQSVSPRVVCGTSAGALNGAVAVAGASEPARVAQLVRLWREMRVDQVYRLTACDLARAPGLVLGSRMGSKPSLVDASPFAELVNDWLPWEVIRRSLDSRQVEAFVVATTDVDNGKSVIFVDGGGERALTSPSHPEQVVCSTRIGPPHCLASAAMPLLFPPVEIGGRLLVDGGLRLNTPLSPALHLGARRLLVVGTHSAPRVAWTHLKASDLSLGFLLGKAMTALLLDPIEQDLRRLTLVNDVLDAGENAFGDEFAPRMEAAALARHQHPVRRVEAVLVRPSEDLGAIAGHVWRSGKVEVSPATHALFAATAATERAEEADLLSFLLFDRHFTAAVEDLGHRDAAAHEEVIAQLFGLGAQTFSPGEDPQAPRAISHG